MTEMLGSSVHWVVWAAAAVIDIDIVSTGYVKDHKTLWARAGAGARRSVVAELNPQS